MGQSQADIGAVGRAGGTPAQTRLWHQSATSAIWKIGTRLQLALDGQEQTAVDKVVLYVCAAQYPIVKFKRV